MLAEGAAELVREHGAEKANGVVPLALGVSLAARGRPEEAQRLIECGAAFLRAQGQPAEVAMALLHQGSVRAFAGGDHRGKIYHRILSRPGDPDRVAECVRAVPAVRHQLGGRAADAAGTPGAPAADQRSVRARHRP
jgi:hypothetical protein